MLEKCNSPIVWVRLVDSNDNSDAELDLGEPTYTNDPENDPDDDRRRGLKEDSPESEESEGTRYKRKRFLEGNRDTKKFLEGKVEEYRILREIANDAHSTAQDDSDSEEEVRAGF